MPKATQLLSLRARKRSPHHNAALVPSPQRYFCFLILTDSWHFFKNSFSLKSIFDVVDLINSQLFMHLMLHAASALGKRGCLPCEQLIEMPSAVKMALFIKGDSFTEVPPAHRMAALGNLSLPVRITWKRFTWWIIRFLYS